MERMKRAVSLFLCFVMVIGMLPTSVFAAAPSEDSLTAAMTEAKTYIDQLTVNNTSNDPEKVVPKVGTHFTWDNEKRESSDKKYLYEWSYYNGVVFEGLDYIYDVTGDTTYYNYVKEYLDAMITNGALNSYAGYVNYHGADCYKTASLLLDYYKLTNDSKYQKVAETLYADLTEAAKTYSLSNAGNNWRHTWADDPSYDLWLDGLYMILPFRAEYAAQVGDTAELNNIVSRLTWVSENMDGEDGWFYHAANNSTNNSGTYWLRSIGWYAAALADVMDSMSGDNLTALQSQLKKLADGMADDQNSYGMWLNKLNASESSSNPYETSGTALIAYAIMKAVNNGWLDKSYADMALNAFVGICEKKLNNNNLTDICFKGAPTNSNSTYYDNEGKGVGPFIMLYAEVLEYTKKNEVVTKEDKNTGVSVTAQGISGLTVTAQEATAKVGETGKTIAQTVADVLNTEKALVSYDITVADFTAGSTATVVVPVPSGMDVNKFAVYYVADNGATERMPGAPTSDGKYEFTTTHFSTYVGGEVVSDAGDAEIDSSNKVTGTGSIAGGYIYTLDTDGVEYGAGNKYLIVGQNNNYVLTVSDNTVGQKLVTVDNNRITLEDSGIYEFYFADNSSKESGSYLLTQDGQKTVYHSGGNLYYGNDNKGYWHIVKGQNGAYRVYDNDGSSWHLNYGYVWWDDGVDRFSVSNSNQRYVRLFKLTDTVVGNTVTFSASPKSSTVKSGSAQDITYEITLSDGTTVTSADIVWASSDTDVATVSNGTVTGVADGTATITATLNSVNGDALAAPIKLEMSVTVQSKAVTSATLTGNDPVTTKLNVEPDFSNIKLKVTYDDGTTGTITVDNGLVIEGYDITTIGYDYASISYAGKEYGTVRVTVEGNPYEGLEEATTYPEYPADGAVRIDKTAAEIDFENTGVVQVELDVAGVSVKPAVDVILVTDLSNSMAWEAGSRTDATSYEATKMYDLQQSVASFADIFLADDGTATKNTMSLVTFGGYDAEHTKKDYTNYADPTQTLLVGSSDASEVKSTINSIRVLADDALNIGTSTTGYYLSFDGGKTYGENYGNTNYDHAFMQTADAIADLKAAYKTANGTDYDASGRQIYILFMTDGAPSNYDGVYYNYNKGNDRADTNCTWVNASGNEVTYTMGNSNAQYQAGPWFEYIAGGSYNAATGTIPGNPLYWADQVYNTTGVANIYSIGFDIDNGGFSSMTFTEKDGRPLAKVLEKLVTGKTLEVYSADDQDGLSKIYADLATKIRYAGTNANVTDEVDSDFDLQLTQTTGSATATTHGNLGFKPTITVTAYDLWTKEETTDTSKIGTRKTNADGSYVREVLETVTFNDAGTEAYSDQVGNKNILTTAADGTVTIEGHYFTFTKTPESVETFKWRLGTITEKEVTLSYYAYLTGTMEGTRPKGLYYTNEEAILEYVDINGDHATKIFPIPAVAWGGASTAYEFYLVNENGEPCDRNGNVVPFANRVIITGPYYEELYLNQADEEVAKEIVAAYVLPAGYTLYDETAKYTVVTASGTIEGSLTISDPAAGKKQTTILVSATEPSYIQSHVAFGVIYNKIPTEATFNLTPDQVVIDYGKPILIDIANGNPDLQDGYTAELVGFSKYYDTVDLKTKFSSTSATDNFKAAYGTFSIEGASTGKVRYTPTKIVNDVEMIFCVIKMYNATSHDTYYMVDWLTVIPATSVYYETNFADDVFSKTTTGTAWSGKTDTADSTATADQIQDDGTVGRANHTYGYDSTYEDDTQLSDGHSWYVEGQGYKNTYTTFSFKGTGFDLISRTGVDQGLIKVEIFSDKAMTVSEKTVTVLNKSEAERSLELYQIPVVSVNDLTYGIHYVRVSVNSAYNNTAYPELQRGNQFYFDAFRVFEPAKGNVTAEAAYAADNEANRQLDEVRALLLAADDFNALTEGTSTTGIVFVDRPNAEAGVGDNEVIQVATYEAIGPNNEVYLNNGQAIAFKIEAKSAPTSIDVGAKTITGGTATLSAVVTDTATTSYSVVKEIKSSTAQNIDLMNDTTRSAMADGNAYVIITNTGADVLSITDIKVAYGNTGVAAASADEGDYGIAMAAETEESDAYAVSYTVDAATFSLARSVLTASEGDEEETPDEPEAEPNYDILDASIKTTGKGKKQKTVITVVTTQDVVELKIVEGKKDAKYSSMEYEDQEDGTRIWTVELSKKSNGKKTYTITGYGEDGTSGASATVSQKSNRR